jgi:nitrogen regulatory protein P-II 1
MTLLEAKTWLRERARPLVFRGTEYMVDVSPVLKIEVVVDEERAEDVVAIVGRATDGDEEVYVSTVESAQGMTVAH